MLAYVMWRVLMSLPAALLAGGLATRLRPLTEKIPKSLIEINGEPFLAHQLRLLKAGGVRRIVLCVGYLGEMVREFAGDGARFGLKLDYSFDGPVLRGTAGALRHALPLLGERFFVLYGDSYLPCNYRAVESAFRQSGKRALMTVYRNEGRWDTSNVEFDSGQILAYNKTKAHPTACGISTTAWERLEARALDAPGGDLAEVYGNLLASGETCGMRSSSAILRDRLVFRRRGIGGFTWNR